MDAAHDISAKAGEGFVEISLIPESRKHLLHGGV